MPKLVGLIAAVAIALPGSLQAARPAPPAGDLPTWTGRDPPNLRTLARAWRVPPSFVVVTPLDDFSRYRAWPQRPPPGFPAG